MKIGNLEFHQPLALAPMEDVTDQSFRLTCRELGADLVYTEFASSEALIRDAAKTLAKIQITGQERPIGIQLFGSVETSMERSAAIAEASGPDFIDINCGCWVKKVAGRGAGAGLLRDLKGFEAIVKAVIKGTTLPVTVKTRLGWDPDSINILDVARMVEQSGAKALTVHCRTRDQGHKGQADWSWLPRIKEVISIPLIGNGDLMTPADIQAMLATGCDGVMIGRGAIQNPWIFQQAKHLLATGRDAPEITLAERLRVCRIHLLRSVALKGEVRGVIEFRKFYGAYLRGLPGIKTLRGEFMALKDLGAVLDKIDSMAVHPEALAVA